MMTTLQIGEGKPTDKTLGELVGHVVTIHGSPAYVAGMCRTGPEQNERALVFYFDQRDANYPFSMPKYKPDLDHGPLGITDAEPVCAPRVEAKWSAKCQDFYVAANGISIGQSFELQHQASDAAEALTDALSKSPTVEDVRADERAKAIEDAAQWLESRGFNSHAAGVRKHFNLPAPDADAKAAMTKVRVECDSEYIAKCMKNGQPCPSCGVTTEQFKPAQPADAVTVEDLLQTLEWSHGWEDSQPITRGDIRRIGQIARERAAARKDGAK